MRVTTTVLSLALALCCAIPAAAQTGGSISLIPNTCTALHHGCHGTPAPGGQLVWRHFWPCGSPAAYPAFVVLDFGGRAWNGGSVPQPVGLLAPSLAGCMQLAAGDLILPMADVSLLYSFTHLCYWQPTREVRWDIPNQQALSGLSFRTQLLLLEPAGPRVSHGAQITIG